MQSKTSSCEMATARTARFSLFHKTVFFKNITRYAPVWALACVFFYCAYYMMFNFGRMDGGDLFDAVPFFTAVNLLYAPLTVWALFGYLHRTREAYALHAMPVSRTARYVTHLCDGLLFGALPYLLFVLFSLINFESGELPALGSWLLVIAGQYLCFFGLAAFSIFCTGNFLGFALIYALLNFGSVLLEQWIRLTYQPLLYGVEFQEGFLNNLCIASLYMNRRVTDYSYYPIDAGIGLAGFTVDISWGIVAFLAALGLFLLAACLWMYRRRRLETAGDLLAVRGLSPVFLLAYTISVATVFAIFGEIFGVSPIAMPYAASGTGLNGFALIGIIVGFFTGRMLLARKVNIFNKRTLLGFVALTAALLLSIGLVKLGSRGIVSRVPEPAQVSSVKITGGGESHTFRDKALIEKVTQLHGEILAQAPAGESGLIDYRYVTIYLDYTLEDGSRLSRRYRVVVQSQPGAAGVDKPGADKPGADKPGADMSDAGNRLLELLREPDFSPFLSGGESFAELAEYVEAVEIWHAGDEIWCNDLTRAELGTLLEALQKDYEAGYLYSDFYSRYSEKERVMTIDIYLPVNIPAVYMQGGDRESGYEAVELGGLHIVLSEEAGHTLEAWSLIMEGRARD